MILINAFVSTTILAPSSVSTNSSNFCARSYPCNSSYTSCHHTLSSLPRSLGIPYHSPVIILYFSRRNRCHLHYLFQSHPLYIQRLKEIVCSGTTSPKSHPTDRERLRSHYHRFLGIQYHPCNLFHPSTLEESTFDHPGLPWP